MNICPPITYPPLANKACKKGLVNVYIFQSPILIALPKTGRFQNNSGRKIGSEDYTKVNPV